MATITIVAAHPKYPGFTPGHGYEVDSTTYAALIAGGFAVAGLPPTFSPSGPTSDGRDDDVLRTVGGVLDAGSLSAVKLSDAIPDTICMVSDSTGADGFNPGGAQTFYTDSIAWWAAAYSQGSLKVGSSCSVGGWVTADVDTHWATRVATPRVRFPVIGIGLNDIYAAADAAVPATEAALRVWYVAKVRQVIGWGGSPVVQTILTPPTGYFAHTTARRAACIAHNQWRRDLARSLALPLLDAESIVTDKADADANLLAAYTQTNSPHPGKEIIRQLGRRLWNDSLKYAVIGGGRENDVSRYSTNLIFTNPALTGTGGNMQTGVGTLPDNVFAWTTGPHTTYSIVPSTDSGMTFTGAPVKSNWINVSTAIGSIAVAGAGQVQSADSPGVLFFSNGLTLSAGDVIKATCEIEVITPNTMVGFSVALQDNTATHSFISPNCSSSFTPSSNADNAKNQLQPWAAADRFQVPEVTLTVGANLTGAGIWLVVTPFFSGLSGATGPAVWRVRAPKVWKVTP